MRTASASSTPSVAAERAVRDALVTGSAMSAWRSSWKAPRPISFTPACPDSSTSGDSPAIAVHSAAAALVKPAPPLTHAMPHCPVSRPHASAMCTAAASWRTWISRRRVPSAASNSGMMWLPDSVKIVVSPAASSVRATMSAPLIWFGILTQVAASMMNNAASRSCWKAAISLTLSRNTRSMTSVGQLPTRNHTTFGGAPNTKLM